MEVLGQLGTPAFTLRDDSEQATTCLRNSPYPLAPQVGDRDVVAVRPLLLFQASLNGR